MKKVIAIAAACAMVFTSTMNVNITKAKIININQVKRNVKATVTIRVHQTLQMKVKGVKAKNIKWQTSNKKVAIVSKKGLVIGKKRGTVTITAKTKKKKYQYKLKVKKSKYNIVLESWWLYSETGNIFGG